MVSANKHRFFSSISFVRISYKTIWLKTCPWYKTHWKMKSGRGWICIFERMRIKNLRGGGGQLGPIRKNSTPSPWKLRKTTSSAFFCASGALGLTTSNGSFLRSSWHELKFGIFQDNFRCSKNLTLSEPFFHTYLSYLYFWLKT